MKNWIFFAIMFSFISHSYGDSYADFRKHGYRCDQPISSSCSNEAHVKIDVGGQCMCVGDKCFNIGIGKDGPSMTSNGEGFMEEAHGSKYQSTPGNGKSSYDKDAIAMGIEGNDFYGKWIHKPANCARAKTYRSKGCIIVDCDNWSIIKSAMRSPRKSDRSISVCNAGTTVITEQDRYNYHSGSKKKSTKKAH